MSATAPSLQRTAAKVTQPRLARPLTRQRLHKALDRMLAEHPMVWVAAPAGSGKTSPVSVYLQSRRQPAIWYQVDERDEDIATCFHYLTEASAQLEPPDSADLPRYSPEYARGLMAFSRSFFGSFFAALPERAVLVFDNYQMVAEDAPLHRVMQVAVEELPVDCRLIVISRHLPPRGYIRLQANQRLAILEQAQLCFDEGEAVALLELRGHHVSDTPELKSWLTINRGWAAGLVLYSEWTRLVHAEFWRLGSLGAESVFDYFAGEIQARVPAQDARFLAQSALLPVIKPALAAELTGNQAAGEVLSRLHRHNTFTTRFDGPTVAYEFHPLFRTYLLKELERSHDSEALTALQCRAASLLALDGQIEAAVDLLADTRQWPQMAALLRKHADELINQGRHQLVGQWLAQLPDELFDQEPWLAYQQGVCRIFGSASESQAWMQRAFRRFKAAGQVEGTYRAWCGVCRAIRLTWGDYRRYDPWIDELDALLDEHSEFPSPTLECQVLFDAIGALHWRNPIHPRMREWTERALVLAGQSGDRSLQVGAHARAAYGALLYDEIPTATRHIQYLERTLTRRVDDPYVDIAARHVMGLHAYAVGRFAQAADIFHDLIEQAHALGLFTWDVYLYVWHGLARLAQGDLAAATKARDELENAPGIEGAFGAYYYHKLCADIALHEHKAEHAMRHAREALAAAERAGTPFMRTWALNTVAIVDVFTEDDRASEDLEIALVASRHLSSRWMEISALVGHALYACLHDSPDAAKRALQETLELMRGQALLGLVQAPQVTRLLAARALDYGVEADYARSILETNSGGRVDASPAQAEAWPWPLKVYTLGSFRLMKYGLPVAFGRKPPRRPLQILKALIAMGGRGVPETHVLDALWPDEEADAARNAFSTALNRLRKIAGRDLVRLEAGKLSLDTTRCWVDAWVFERFLDEAGPRAEAAVGQDSLRHALELYQGKFLAEDAEAPWSMSMRERLQRRYAEAIARLANAYQRDGDHEGAVALFNQGLAMDELREDYYQGLMRSYLELAKPDEARQAFEFCKRRLGIRQNRKPSAPTLALFESIERRYRA